MPLDVSNYYLIRCLPNGPNIMVRRGEAPPVITGGGARYNLVERPRRTSAVQWVGTDPWRMDLSIMFDGWVGNVSVEKDIQELNRMFLPNADLTPPRTIMIDGPTPVKGAKWVIEGIDWGTRTIWRSGKGWTKGERLRQDATVHLLQIVPETVLKKLSPTTGLTIHTVKSGETVRKIAAKHGVSVAAIKKANKIRDPKTVKTGQTIKVPPSTSGSTYSNVLPVPKGMAFSKETADNRPDTSGRVPPIHWNPR